MSPFKILEIFGMHWKKFFVKATFLYTKFSGHLYSLSTGSNNIKLKKLEKYILSPKRAERVGVRDFGTFPLLSISPNLV